MLPVCMEASTSYEHRLLLNPKHGRLALIQTSSMSLLLLLCGLHIAEKNTGPTLKPPAVLFADVSPEVVTCTALPPGVHCRGSLPHKRFFHTVLRLQSL